MKAIVVGAGGTTRELLRRLGEVWEVVLVSADEHLLKEAAAIRPCEAVVGDGSSAVVLRRAGVADADAVVAASADDDLNLEALRIAIDNGVLRTVGVAAHPERIPDYRALGVPAYAPDSLTARHVEVMLEPRRVASTAFADGKAEAIEFSIMPDAPIRGRRLRDLQAETWVVAAVLRDGQMIVPHGNTTIETGDRVTVVGAASDFKGIVKTFTSGESSFPIGYGRKAVVGLRNEHDLDSILAEAANFVRNSRAETLIVVHRDPETEKDPARATEIETLITMVEDKTKGIDVELRPAAAGLDEEVMSVSSQESVGTLILPAPLGGRITRRRRFVRMLNRFGPAGVPLLISRGRHPYSEILAPARQTTHGEVAGRAAIDMAKSTGAMLTGIAIVGPTFVTTPDTMANARVSSAWLREEAAMQSVTVRRRIQRGNPVRILQELAEEADLVVLAMPAIPVRIFRPGVAGYVGESVDSSVLLVPPIP